MKLCRYKIVEKIEGNQSSIGHSLIAESDEYSNMKIYQIIHRFECWWL
jgi:hypothetical protein